MTTTFNGKTYLEIRPAPEIKPPPKAAKDGTYEGWQTAIEAALSVADCPHWT